MGFAEAGQDPVRCRAHPGVIVSIARVAGSKEKKNGERGGTHFAFHGLAPEATAKRPLRGLQQYRRRRIPLMGNVIKRSQWGEGPGI